MNRDTDDLKQAGNLGLWKAVPKFDATRGMKFLTYAAPAIRNAMMDMVRDAFAAFEQRMVTEDKDGVCYQRVSPVSYTHLDVYKRQGGGCHQRHCQAGGRDRGSRDGQADRRHEHPRSLIRQEDVYKRQLRPLIKHTLRCAESFEKVPLQEAV